MGDKQTGRERHAETLRDATPATTITTLNVYYLQRYIHTKRKRKRTRKLKTSLIIVTAQYELYIHTRTHQKAMSLSPSMCYRVNTPLRLI